MGDVVSLTPPPAAEPVVAPPITTDASTIREMIDAGRCPRDERGRALVPMRCGTTAAIASTNEPEPRCIAGCVGADDQPTTWLADGRWHAWDHEPGMLDLMPPGYVPPGAPS